MATLRHHDERPAERIVKVGLAFPRGDTLLTVRKRGGGHYILPGGKLEPGESDREALRREIKEELDCELDEASLTWLGEFEDEAADQPGATVVVRLYSGRLAGRPRASSEIVEVHWFNPSVDDPSRLAPSIRNQILQQLPFAGEHLRWRST